MLCCRHSEKVLITNSVVLTIKIIINTMSALLIILLNNIFVFMKKDVEHYKKILRSCFTKYVSHEI
jgi:hypothetical protein